MRSPHFTIYGVVWGSIGPRTLSQSVCHLEVLIPPHREIGGTSQTHPRCPGILILNLPRLGRVHKDMAYYHKPLDCPVILLRGWGTKTCEPGHRTWHDIEAYLTRAGIPYVVPYYHRFGSIEERAQSVIEQIGQLYPWWRVHLVGHSMVCRFPTSKVHGY